jgi:O-antigen/teichoic acid export membrane protein
MVRKVLWVLLGYAARLTFQFGTFLLLARHLGVDGFGAFAGVLALVGLISPFVEWGGYSLIVRDIKAGARAERAFGNSLMLSALTVPIGLLALAALKPLALPAQSWVFVLCIGVGQFVGGRTSALVFGIHTAQDDNWRNTVLEVIQGAGLFGFVLLLSRFSGDLERWGLYYLVNSVIVGAFATAWIVRRHGRPTTDLGEVRARVRPGFHFAVASSAQSAYTDLDKVMLVRLGSEQAAGVYTAAYRLINVAYLPLGAILYTTYPQFFASGQRGLVETRAWAHRVARWSVAYGVLASAALWLLAPLVPVLLGTEYAESVGALRLLCVMLLLQGLTQPFGDVLTGTGRQRLRGQVQLGVLVLNIVLNLLLIPGYGWAGASWASVITQVVLCGTFIWIVERAKD